MSGPNSTSGNIPYTTNQPVTHSTPQKPNDSGVNPLEGQRYTPESESTPASVSIHMRTPRVQKGVLPQVNREKIVEKLQSGYTTHYAQAEAKRDQLDLAHSLKEIRHYLDNPALAKECTSYSIMWIPDEGEPVSVIPPGKELDDRTKASEIKGMLHGQLDKLDQKFTVSKLQQLEEDIEEQEALMNVAARQLHDMGASLPKLPSRERIVLLGGTSSKGTQPSPPTPLTETGQHTTPPTTPTPVTPPDIPEETKPLQGQFELRLKKPEAPKPFQPLGDEQDEDDLWETFEDTSHNTHPPKREKSDEASKPLLSFDDESDDVLDDVFYPPTRTTERTEHQSGQKPSPNIARPRPKPSNPVPNSIGPLTTRTSAATPYETIYLPAGIDGRHSDIFKPHNSQEDNLIASVNSGNPTLGFADEEQSVGFPPGISDRFNSELKHRGDTSKYGPFHNRMLSNGKLNRLYEATQEDLQISPELAYASVLKSDINRKGKHAGTVIIDVFDSDYPQQNETNQAMIYVVPPDGADYDDPQQYLADCEETAKRLVWTLNRFNINLSEDHQAKHRLGQQPITTLRTCAFGTGSSKHPNVSASEVAGRIARGINAEIETIRQSPLPLTITRVEFEDGASAVFSGPSTPVELSTEILTPTIAPPPPQEPLPPPPPPTPPSKIALQLMECPPQVGTTLDANMGALAKEALRITHPKAVFEQKANPGSLYAGPLHSARKAMLARAITNFHRKHSRDTSAITRDAGYIPDSAIPAVELGVLSTKPAPNAVLNQNGRIGLWLDPNKHLLQKQVPEATAGAIATATTGYNSNPEYNLLDSILKDVELIESKRASAGFDISELETYRLYPNKHAREELGKLCAEYYGMLRAQGDLPPPTTKMGEKPPATFRLSDNKTSVISDLERAFNPTMRQHLEKSDDFYEHQVNQLKSAASVPSTTPEALSSLGFHSEDSGIKTFAKLYTFSRDNN